jgi:bifunctional NMN adenylyltransferase/nudix hydrolase
MINYGVIVGRFQVNELHPGQAELLRQVSKLHERVIVFVGVPRTVPTKRNPMDFEVRKKMIQHDYPDFTVLPLRDERSDDLWSQNLDQAIEAVTQLDNNVTLYGGRDSFVPHYFGRHQVHQLEIPSPTTGTEVREKLSNQVMESKEFRAGVIYAAFNRFPRLLTTVDVAILHNTGIAYNTSASKIKMLLGRKLGETNWRFIGGFANNNESFEYAARREVYEETHLDISSVEYLGSYPIKDWRYLQDVDAGITTVFYMGWSTSQYGRASDDINEIKWFDFDALPHVVTEEHAEMFEKIKKLINFRYYNNELTFGGQS